jgi:small subunit ribosomal protein S14
MSNSIIRDLYRRNSVAKAEIQRQILTAQINDLSSSPTQRFQSALLLNSFSRDSSKSRVRARCQLSGRSRGILSQWKLSRILFRKLAQQGLLAGVRKSSW